MVAVDEEVPVATTVAEPDNPPAAARRSSVVPPSSGSASAKAVPSSSCHAVTVAVAPVESVTQIGAVACVTLAAAKASVFKVPARYETLDAVSLNVRPRLRLVLYTSVPLVAANDAAGPWITVVVVRVVLLVAPAGGAVITTVIVVVPTAVGVTVKLIVADPEEYETVAATEPTVTVMLDAAKFAVLGPERTKVHVPLATEVLSAQVPTATEVGSWYKETVVVAGAPRNGPTAPAGEVTRTYTYHVPAGIVVVMEAELDVKVPVPACVRPAALVMPAVAA